METECKGHHATPEPSVCRRRRRPRLLVRPQSTVCAASPIAELDKLRSPASHCRRPLPACHTVSGCRPSRLRPLSGEKVGPKNTSLSPEEVMCRGRSAMPDPLYQRRLIRAGSTTSLYSQAVMTGRHRPASSAIQGGLGPAPRGVYRPSSYHFHGNT